MQISAANLLATQSQASVRSRGTAAAFEPIAFKQSPQAAVTQDLAKPAASASASASAAPSISAGSKPYGGYVRPGTNLDIKI